MKPTPFGVGFFCVLLDGFHEDDINSTQPLSVKRFGLKSKSRLTLAVENRLADFQGSGLRLRFSFASVAPDRKKTRYGLPVENLAVSNSACFAFFCGRLFIPPPNHPYGIARIYGFDIVNLQLNIEKRPKPCGVSRAAWPKVLSSIENPS